MFCLCLYLLRRTWQRWFLYYIFSVSVKLHKNFSLKLSNKIGWFCPHVLWTSTGSYFTGSWVVLASWTQEKPPTSLHVIFQQQQRKRKTKVWVFSYLPPCTPGFLETICPKLGIHFPTNLVLNVSYFCSCMASSVELPGSSVECQINTIVRNPQDFCI